MICREWILDIGRDDTRSAPYDSVSMRCRGLRCEGKALGEKIRNDIYRVETAESNRSNAMPQTQTMPPTIKNAHQPLPPTNRIIHYPFSNPPARHPRSQNAQTHPPSHPIHIKERHKPFRSPHHITSHRLLLRRRTSRSLLLARLILPGIRNLILQNLDEPIEEHRNHRADRGPEPVNPVFFVEGALNDAGAEGAGGVESVVALATVDFRRGGEVGREGRRTIHLYRRPRLIPRRTTRARWLRAP